MKSSTMKLIIAVTALSVAVCSAARAEAPVGGRYYDKALTATTTVFTPAFNVAGIHLRTIVISCFNNTWLSATFPGKKSKTFFACNPNGGPEQGQSNAQDIYLQPGWGLVFNTGGISPGALNFLQMTYDKN